VTDEVMAASDRLRLVGCARGGPVNVDLAAANELGVPVVNTPGKNAPAVADQTIALMIMLARGFRNAMRTVESGVKLGESAFEGAEFLGSELEGKTLGLIGFGQVGRRVAARAAGFGMAVVVFDPFAPPAPQPGIEPVADLAELLGRTDFVSLHARATPENENLVGREEIAQMRRGAFLVNTARETLLDEQAVFEGLEGGQLAGVGLDVIRPHEAEGPHPLLAFDNVVLLPHIGGATHETLMRGVTMLADNVRRLHSGVPLQHVVAGMAAPR
jgi:D-3-phosphoglycerate dehydrogenase